MVHIGFSYKKRRYNDNDNDKFNDNDNDNDLRISFANNFNDNVNVNDNDNDNAIDNDNYNDNDNDNDLRSSFAINDNDNDNQGTCFADDLQSSFANQGTDSVRGMPTCSADNDNVIYQFDEKHQKGKPNNKECPTNTISININEDLQSWLNHDKINTEATLPENFRCIISGPSECGKTFLLKKLILARIYFDKLYIIGPTGDQYIGLERIYPIADIKFIKDIKDLPSPDKLPKDLKKLMIFDDIRAKEPVNNEYCCRGRYNNCNMINLNQNLFTIDRQSVRENCNLFILFEQRGKVLISIYQDFFNYVELSYNGFANMCYKVWKEPYNYIVIDKTKKQY